jgi:hypothetical protein
MNPTTLESEIAKATKLYVQQEWHLDVTAFGRTQNRAWVRLAGRILDRPGATIPARGLQTGGKLGGTRGERADSEHGQGVDLQRPAG